MSNLTSKNKKTGKSETIIQQEITRTDWGFNFQVDTELEAYKAAYQYRNSIHGVQLQFAAGTGKWLITVFNCSAVRIGLDGAK